MVERCVTGNGTTKQKYFENTLTFVSKPSPEKPAPIPEDRCKFVEKVSIIENETNRLIVVYLFRSVSNLMTIRTFGNE